MCGLNAVPTAREARVGGPAGGLAGGKAQFTVICGLQARSPARESSSWPWALGSAAGAVQAPHGYLGGGGGACFLSGEPPPPHSVQGRSALVSPALSRVSTSQSIRGALPGAPRG